jgi:hypothetical protein
MTIINLTHDERWKLEVAQRSHGKITAYNASEQKALTTLAAQGLVELTGPNQGAMTELGTQTLEFVASKKQEEDTLWKAVQKTIDRMPQGRHGSSRGAPLFTHHDDGTAVARCMYSQGNADGTNTNHLITATLPPNGQTLVQIEDSEDHADWFWGPGGVRDGDDPTQRVVVDHTHYIISLDTSSHGFKGFGGRRWCITFFDGRTVTTNNLWCQGTIPPKWRERFPDNAEFLPQDIDIIQFLPPTS